MYLGTAVETVFQGAHGVLATIRALALGEGTGSINIRSQYLHTLTAHRPRPCQHPDQHQDQHQDPIPIRTDSSSSARMPSSIFNININININFEEQLHISIPQFH